MSSKVTHNLSQLERDYNLFKLLENRILNKSGKEYLADGCFMQSEKDKINEYIIANLHQSLRIAQENFNELNTKVNGDNASLMAVETLSETIANLTNEYYAFTEANNERCD